MNSRAKLLSLGTLMPVIDQALEARFEVLREGPAGDLDAVIAAHGGEIRAIVTRGQRRTDAALIARLPKLELIANFGVGYDTVEVEAAAARGVVVTNTPDVLNDEMGDFTVGLLLATVRQLPLAERHLRGGHWRKGAFPLGPSLRGRRIGIAGMGRIGRVIAHRLSGFDLPISYHARNRVPDIDFAYHPDLVGLAQAVDVLIVVLPGGETTRHAVNAEVLAALGADGVLINVARGSVVDEEALIAALRDGTILAAGLDVFAAEPHVPDELRAMDNVVLVPHIGTATHHTRGLMADLLIRNVMSWFDGAGPVTPVSETPVVRRG
ncbi:MAG: 2-hydroxyacid dehydrogenase [Acidiphilium sp.]|nr:2-hydroxyacid dehydrogenase [Acidiphilium sp.]